jgi:hypothetical protein
MPNMKDIPTKQYFTGKGAGEVRYNPEKGSGPETRVHRRLDNVNAEHNQPDHSVTTHPTRTITKIYSPSGHMHSPVRPPMPKSDRAIHGPEKKGEPSPPMSSGPKDNWKR